MMVATKRGNIDLWRLFGFRDHNHGSTRESSQRRHDIYHPDVSRDIVFRVSGFYTIYSRPIIIPHDYLKTRKKHSRPVPFVIKPHVLGHTNSGPDLDPTFRSTTTARHSKVLHAGGPAE